METAVTAQVAVSEMVSATSPYQQQSFQVAQVGFLTGQDS